jgi:hypothetical protein
LAKKSGTLLLQKVVGQKVGTFTRHFQENAFCLLFFFLSLNYYLFIFWAQMERFIAKRRQNNPNYIFALPKSKLNFTIELSVK